MKRRWNLAQWLRPAPPRQSRVPSTAKTALATAQAEVETARLTAEKTLIESQTKLVTESGGISLLDREIGHLFDLYHYQTGDAIDEANFLQMARNAYQLWAVNGLGHGLVETFVKFVVGQEVKLKALDEDPETQIALDEFAAGYELPNGRRTKPFSAIANEHTRRKFRDPDSLLRYFVNPANGDVHVRFMNPMWIANAFGEYGDRGSFGVLTNARDIEDVEHYIYWPTGFDRYYYRNRTDYTLVPAGEVIHAKLEADSDAKRGRPLLLPVAGDLIEFIRLKNSRMAFHQLRTLVYKQVTYQGAHRETIEAITERNKATKASREKHPRPGSINRLTGNVDVEYKTPNLQAQDADADFRRFFQPILVGLGIPEHVGLADASNNNYGSGELTESPMERTMRCHQLGIAPDFVCLGEKLLQAKVATGMLSRDSFKSTTKVSTGVPGVSPDIVTKSSETVRRNLKVTVDFPRLKERDILRETQSIIIQMQNRLISRETAQIDLDRDPQMENDQMRIERQRDAEELGTVTDDIGLTQKELSVLGAHRTPPSAGNPEGGRYGGKNGTNGKNGQNGTLSTTKDYR